MRRRPSIRRSFILTIATVLLALAGAGNVLAEGVQASPVGVYAGMPGRGGRLVTPQTVRATSLDRAAHRLLITTAEHAPALETSWQTAARAATELDPRGALDPAAPPSAVVLTQTHAEGRVHTARVRPEAQDATLPVHPGPIHHEGGASPWPLA